MSRIDDLIIRFAPDGVIHQRLGDVARIRNGRDYKHLGEGDIPVYGTGGVMKYVDQAAYDKPSVLIPRKGSLSKLYFVDRPFWTVDTIFYTEVYDAIIPKFFYYYLLTQHLEKLNQAGGVPSLTQSVLNELLIPVPPLEVQREIVKILDHFTLLETELEAQLQAELDARRVQYAFYRDSLLTFPETGGVRRVPMGDFAELVRGNGLPKADFTDTGIGAIHYGQIYTFYGTWATKTKSHVAAGTAAKLAKVDPGDIVMTNTSENFEDVGKAVAWLGNEQVVTGGHATVIKHSQNAKYLVYYFQTTEFAVAKRKHASGTKVIDVSAKSLAKIEVPLPSLDEQNRLVAILDDFELLLNGLANSLPAELDARRLQYEYFRDRLLTFEGAKV